MEPTPQQVRSEIAQLESLRRQSSWWRIGATLAVAAVTVGCLAALNSSVRGLTEAGPTQKVFTDQLSQNMQESVVPSLRTLATQTFTEIQPQAIKELNNWNKRTPELTDATMKQLETLRTELPKSGEKTLNDTFGKVLVSREQKIRQMYPDVKEEQIKGLVSTLQRTGEEEFRNANSELFGPHQAALSDILDQMETIRNSQAASVKGADPSWEMGLAILDVLRDDLKDLAPRDFAPKGSQKAPSTSTTNEGGKA